MAGETVTVACRLPHGLVLRLFELVDKDVPVMGGGMKTVKEAQELPHRVTLNGWSHPQNEAPKCQLVAGFALTPNVSKEFFDRWMHENKDSDVVKNGLIFAHTKEGNAIAESRDKKGMRSGLERLDPDKLPKGIKKADAAASA